MKYDAIIVGGSFAGLSVASQLKGNILLIDRKEIGEGQTSACAGPLEPIRAAGAEASVLQTYNCIFLHTALEDIEFKLNHTFCTFDYKKFCGIMSTRSEAKVIKAAALGMNGSSVMTDAGEFTSECIIDCSGWRATLASSWKKDFVNKSRLSFGIETVLDYPEKHLRFYFDPRLLENGVIWVFPCGSKTRFGVGSYIGETRLKERLAAFLSKLGLKMGNLHGGYFPHELRSPTVGRLFLVGDSGGQCMPFSAEGIRPAMYFGTHCGQIVQRVIEGELTLEEGLLLYQRFVKSHRIYFKITGWLQWLINTVPNFWSTQLGKLMSIKSVSDCLLNHYIQAFKNGLEIKSRKFASRKPPLLTIHGGGKKR